MTPESYKPSRILACAQLADSIGDGVHLVPSALSFARIVGRSFEPRPPAA